MSHCHFIFWFLSFFVVCFTRTVGCCAEPVTSNRTVLRKHNAAYGQVNKDRWIPWKLNCEHPAVKKYAQPTMTGLLNRTVVTLEPNPPDNFSSSWEPSLKFWRCILSEIESPSVLVALYAKDFRGFLIIWHNCTTAFLSSYLSSLKKLRVPLDKWWLIPLLWLH